MLLGCKAHTATIPVGMFPFGIAYDPSRDNIYVANPLSSTVSVISGSTNSVIATTLVERDPFWLVYVPPNNQIYVTNVESNDVYVISGVTNRVVKTIGVGSFTGIAYDSTSQHIYVTNRNSNTVTMIHL